MKIGRDSYIEKLEPSSDGMNTVEGYENILKNYRDYLRDESNLGYGRAEKLFFPKSLRNIAWVVLKAAEEGKTVTVSGGRTGICGGSVPDGGWLLSLEKMNRVLGLKCERNEREFVLSVESGVRLNEISRILKEKQFPFSDGCVEKMVKSKKKYFYPPDPTETTATIGGTIATNASGARTLRFGPTRGFIEALDIIVLSGHHIRIRRGEVLAGNGYFRIEGEGLKLNFRAPSYNIPETKHSAGFYSANPMDFIDLFIGSEGTLGIIAGADIRVVEWPEEVISGLTFFRDEDSSLDFVEDARYTMRGVTALEYFDHEAMLLIEKLKKIQGPVSEIPDFPSGVCAIYFESFHESLVETEKCLKGWRDKIAEHGGAVDETIASVENRDMERLKVVRHSVPEEINRKISKIKIDNPEIHKVGTDMAVPDGKLRGMLGYYRKLLKESGIYHVIFGHIGNNHLHVNMIPKNTEELERSVSLYRSFAEKAVELGGTVSGEHGIGKLKKEYLKILFSESDINQMRKIKNIFDPTNMLNPGVIFE